MAKFNFDELKEYALTNELFLKFSCNKEDLHEKNKKQIFKKKLKNHDILPPKKKINYFGAFIYYIKVMKTIN